MMRSLFAGPIGNRSARMLALTLAFTIIAATVPFSQAFARPIMEHRPVRKLEKLLRPEMTGPYVSACVMEPTTGAIIFHKDMHKEWPTASLAKMMLMLIVAQKLHNGSIKLSDMITTSRRASEMGGSQVYLKEGETFPLNDMMEAIVVHSANDASVAVAEYIAGSSEAFVDMMNREAKRLGLNDTHYYSVTGLPPDPGQKADVSSAYDLAVLARRLVKYPQILRWSSINTAPFRHGTFQLMNTNHLIRTYPGCDGLKTGYYYEAGFNVVATAHRNGLRLIAVVLGSRIKDQNFKEAATMLTQGFMNYDMRKIAKKGSDTGQSVAVTDGTTASIKPVWSRDVSVFVKRDSSKDAYKISYSLPKAVQAPVKAGQPIGMAVVNDGDSEQEIPVVASQNVGRGSLWQRLMAHL